MKYKDYLEITNARVENAKQSDEDDSSLLTLRNFKLSPVPDSKVKITDALEAVSTIVRNVQQNKYLFSILITAALKKIFDENQDIRLSQDSLSGGYSNRSLDQNVVTPFLKRYGYTSCAASGLESGRNFERPLPWDLTFPCNPRGQGNREAFLQLIDLIQREPKSAPEILYALLYLDALGRGNDPVLVVPPLEANLDHIMLVFNRHFQESSGQGKSRLPVLALYSIYELLVPELFRYQNACLQPLENHTTADLRSGSIGDIQVDRTKQPFEGVEVKSERPITPDMLRELKRKLEGLKVNRYYVLSTFPGAFLPEDEIQIRIICEEILSSTGCQVIVDGLNNCIHYLLRVIEDPSKVLGRYSLLLVEDSSVRPDLISKWNEILQDEYPDFSGTAKLAHS